MKTTNISIFLTMLMMLITSCEHYDVDMLTTINEDGSCSREFTINVKTEKNNGQTGQIVYKDIVFDNFCDSSILCFDDTWNKSWSVKGDSSEKSFPISIKEQKALKQRLAPKDNKFHPKDTLNAYARQDFASIDAMTSTMPLRFNGKALSAKGELTKSFKWFYTEYTYKETYANVASEFEIPLSKHIDEDAASYWYTGTPDIMADRTGAETKEFLNTVEDKINQWGTANLIVDIVNLMADNYNFIANPPVDRKQFLANKDSLISFASSHIDQLWGEEDFMQKLFQLYYSSDVYGNALSAAPISELFDKMFLSKYAMPNYIDVNYILSMPGTIVSADKGMVQNNRAYFKLSPTYLYQKDYTITATSRVANVWAYIISVIIILLAILSFIYKRKK